ncbi:MAG: hypothetical protein TREMPRED_004541 [Tremellales sp. Tagirdzhanova-0007]|nr:MAG: hypothetical protein TREMPRED_004541 [Tremellales sp. Tagirdzhanova-0007]
MPCFPYQKKTAGSMIDASEKPQTADVDETQRRLRDLRKEISDAKVDWYVVPSADEHLSEFVGVAEKRREYITGYNSIGDAGTAIIPSSSIQSPAMLFVAATFWNEAEQTLPKEDWKIVKVGSRDESGALVGDWPEWAVKRLLGWKELDLLVVDRGRWLKDWHGPKIDFGKSTRLVFLASNLVDRIYSVPRSIGPLRPYPVTLSGTAEWVYILPTLPAIAWLLNYRCPTDIPFVPVAYAYLVLTPTTCVIFVDQRKVQDEELKARFIVEGIQVQDYGVYAVGQYVKSFIAETTEKQDGKTSVTVWAPPECNWALYQACSPSETEIIPCPVDIAKAVKNPVEQQGFRNAYLRDGRAMVRWMAWLDTKLVKEQRSLGEWVAVQTLTRFRRQEEMFAGLAYEDISASGPNGAFPHYITERGKDRIIDFDSPYIIDSGGQYHDATIDTTRTLYYGKTPSEKVKRAYTRVLQGHIAVSASNFPIGTDGKQLQMVARALLYRDGLDFRHGLGHGVGSYLAVHENPSAFRGSTIEPGHVTSIEPGFYANGEFGIRIESVYLCQNVDTMYNFGGNTWLGWERVTQVPIQTFLCDWNLMSKDEIRWINAHNTSVEDALLPLLQEDQDKEARDWLKIMSCIPATSKASTGKCVAAMFANIARILLEQTSRGGRSND